MPHEQLQHCEEEVSREEQRPTQLAPEGVGPLLQRDYLIRLRGSACTPEQVIDLVRQDLPRYSPDLLARFSRAAADTGPLEVGDTLHVRISGAGHAAVIVSHRDSRSLTVRTLEGHLEAGRNTWGAYYDSEGRLVCRIRSRSRIRDWPRAAMYHWLFGKHAQAKIWSTYVERLGEACGGERVGEVEVTTEEVDDSSADRGEEEGPTFSPWPDGGDPDVAG